MTETPTAQDRVDYLSRKALREIQYEAQQLRRNLNDAKRSIDFALDQMDKGLRAQTEFISIRQITLGAEKLRSMCALASDLGVDQDEINKAYGKKVGE